jgi:hypothetical protein
MMTAPTSTAAIAGHSEKMATVTDLCSLCDVLKNIHPSDRDAQGAGGNCEAI